MGAKLDARSLATRFKPDSFLIGESTTQISHREESAVRFNYTELVGTLLGILCLMLVGMGCEKQPMEPTDLVTTSLAAEEAATSLVTAGEDNDTGGRLNHLAACNLGN